MCSRNSANATHLVQPSHGDPAHSSVYPRGMGDPHQCLWGGQDWVYHQGWWKVLEGVQEELQAEGLGYLGEPSSGVGRGSSLGTQRSDSWEEGMGMGTGV